MSRVSDFDRCGAGTNFGCGYLVADGDIGHVLVGARKPMEPRGGHDDDCNVVFHIGCCPCQVAPETLKAGVG